MLVDVFKRVRENSERRNSNLKKDKKSVVTTDPTSKARVKRAKKLNGDLLTTNMPHTCTDSAFKLTDSDTYSVDTGILL